ncbi:GntR family transcriptional regulator [Megamonas funiformis]|uniref:GntR family transcriptional regulator n=1 Tax=Megamonas funiformis TaxID=437897 RepID=UPI003899EA5B
MYQLPSETDLSAQLKVSRTTLRQALALLQDDGLLNRPRLKSQGSRSSILTNTVSPSYPHSSYGSCIYYLIFKLCLIFLILHF